MLIMLAPLTGFQASRAARSTVWQNKVDPWVLRTMSQAPTEFLVFLKEQADLSPARQYRTKLEKGSYVYNQLTQTAQDTQAPILAALQDLSRRSPGKVDFRSYWVANLIWVRGDSNLVQALAVRDDVAHLYANPHVRLEAPLPAETPLAPDQPSGIESNILKVGAPEVWAHGFTGQGVVIGGADTGYQWQHSALKADIAVGMGPAPTTTTTGSMRSPAAAVVADPNLPSRAMMATTARIPWASWSAQTG